MRITMLVSVVFCAGMAIAQSSAFKYSQRDVTTATSDSLLLSSKMYSSPGKSTRSFICLPMMGHTRNSFAPLRDSLTAISRQTDSVNFSLPNWQIFDLRGHGASIHRGEVKLDYRTMTEPEFAKYPTDIAGALKGRTGVTVIGASIGANTAALLTEQMSGIDQLVLLSPGMNYRGLEPADAIMTFKGKILLVASSGDEYSYNSVREMASLNPDHCTLMIFDGDAHGTDIINENPAAMRALVDWLLKN